MEALSLLKNLPISKSGVEDIVNAAVDDILSGRQNPLMIAIKLKAMEDIIKAIRANQDVKDFTMNEADIPDHGKTFDFMGAKITIAEQSKYDFSTDKQWTEMNNEINLKKDILKIRENTLKSLDKEMADPTTGEVYIPPKKTTEKQLRINLK
jgi:hypothetical protein